MFSNTKLRIVHELSIKENPFQALLSAIGVGEKSATVIGATFQVSSSFIL